MLNAFFATAILDRIYAWHLLSSVVKLPKVLSNIKKINQKRG